MGKRDLRGKQENGITETSKKGKKKKMKKKKSEKRKSEEGRKGKWKRMKI